MNNGARNVLLGILSGVVAGALVSAFTALYSHTKYNNVRGEYIEYLDISLEQASIACDAEDLNANGIRVSADRLRYANMRNQLRKIEIALDRASSHLTDSEITSVDYAIYEARSLLDIDPKKRQLLNLTICIDIVKTLEAASPHRSNSSE